MDKNKMKEKIKSALTNVTSALQFPEMRNEQLQMSDFIYRFLNYAKEPGLATIIEAGTGVGKTFAYLVPICEYLSDIKDEETKTKVVIATNTISLQEQLIQKDIPVIQNFYPDIRIEKAKGRNNYVCLRLINNLQEGNLFTTYEEDLSLMELERWASDSSTGDKSDLPFEVEEKAWQSVQSDALTCHGNACYFNNRCFYNKARKKLYDADIIIANHALVLTDLQNPVLPGYTHIVIDEAHNFEKNALKAFTIEIDLYRFLRITKKLNNNYCQAGLRVIKKQAAVQNWINNTIPLAEKFLYEFPDGRVKESVPSEDGEILIDQLHQIIPTLSQAIKKSQTPIIKKELTTAAEEIEKLSSEIAVFLYQSENDYVYWAEKGKLKYAPITTKHLRSFWNNKTAILTSATLSVANSFKSIIFNLSLNPKSTYTLKLDSPFNYRENALLYIPKTAISPKNGEFAEYIIETIPEIVERTGGKTFILFTSFQLLNYTYENLQDKLKNYTLLKQANGNKEQIVKEFRESDKPVLFGTDTFWEGVDENINCVIITKLPFAVPTDPIEEAVYEKILKLGKNPFLIKSIPSCALKLKQGVGRLIRNSKKRGVIVILDPRITSSWGKPIIKTLPEMRMTSDITMLNTYTPMQKNL